MKHTITTAFFLSLIVFGFSQSVVPHFDWVKQAGGGYTNYGKSIAVDANGNSYIAGYFRGTANFGGITISAADYSVSAFIAKLDADGNFLWVKSPEESSSQAFGIAVDTEGNSYGQDKPKVLALIQGVI